MEPLLTTAQVADLLGVRPDTLRKLRARGGGPPSLRVGGRLVRYDPAAVRAWVASRDWTLTETQGGVVR